MVFSSLVGKHSLFMRMLRKLHDNRRDGCRKMANIAALTATTLDHFGFNEPTRTYFNAFGLTMIVDLLT